MDRSVAWGLANGVFRSCREARTTESMLDLTRQVAAFTETRKSRQAAEAFHARVKAHAAAHPGYFGYRHRGFGLSSRKSMSTFLLASGIDSDRVIAKESEDLEETFRFTANSLLVGKTGATWLERSLPVSVSLHALARYFMRGGGEPDGGGAFFLGCVRWGMLVGNALRGIGMKNVPILCPLGEGAVLGLTSPFDAGTSEQRVEFRDGAATVFSDVPLARRMLAESHGASLTSPDLGVDFRTFIHRGQMAPSQVRLCDAMAALLADHGPAVEATVHALLFESDHTVLLGVTEDLHAALMALQEALLDLFTEDYWTAIRGPKGSRLLEVEGLFEDRE